MAGRWFGPPLYNSGLGMGKSASLRPPMPLVAVRALWVAMAVGLRSANFPVPLLSHQGGTTLDIPTIDGNEGCASFEAAGRKLEMGIGAGPAERRKQGDKDKVQRNGVL